MNLYKYLLGSEDRRQKFCVELIKRFPEIYEWSMNKEKFIYMKEVRNFLAVHTTTSIGSNWSYNIFNIFDKPLTDEYQISGVLDRKNLSCSKPYDLQPLVLEWCIQYENKIMREYKIKRILL